MRLHQQESELELKRQAIASAYSGKAWKEKCRIMSDGQVIAVYIRLKNSGKI